MAEAWGAKSRPRFICLRPLSGKQLMRRLHRLGIRARPVRSTALLDLAAGLPAVVLSKLLGIHIRSATRWTQHSGAS